MKLDLTGILGAVIFIIGLVIALVGYGSALPVISGCVMMLIGVALKSMPS